MHTERMKTENEKVQVSTMPVCCAIHCIIYQILAEHKGYTRSKKNNKVHVQLLEFL